MPAVASAQLFAQGHLLVLAGGFGGLIGYIEGDALLDALVRSVVGHRLMLGAAVVPHRNANGFPGLCTTDAICSRRLSGLGRR